MLHQLKRWYSHQPASETPKSLSGRYLTSLIVRSGHSSSSLLLVLRLALYTLVHFLRVIPPQCFPRHLDRFSYDISFRQIFVVYNMGMWSCNVVMYLRVCGLWSRSIIDLMPCDSGSDQSGSFNVDNVIDSDGDDKGCVQGAPQFLI